MKKREHLYTLVLIWVLLGFVVTNSMAAEVKKISIKDLQAIMNEPDVVIVDVRTRSDWKKSSEKIKGAVRENPGKVRSWINKYPSNKRLIFYCAWHDEYTSARVVQKFLAQGYTKVYALKGGWLAWVAAKYPIEKKWILSRRFKITSCSLKNWNFIPYKRVDYSDLKLPETKEK